MAGKFNTPSMTGKTPRGLTRWTNLSKGNEYNKLETKFILSPEAAAEFEATLKPMLDAAYDEELSRNKTPDKVVKADLNKGTDEDGNVIFKFSNPEVDKGGKPTLIKVYNVSGQLEQELGERIGNGTTAIIKYFAFPYYMASSKTVGVSIRMNAVQVIDLQEYTSSEFDDEGEGDEEQEF